jgi:hypothetical protein
MAFHRGAQPLRKGNVDSQISERHFVDAEGFDLSKSSCTNFSPCALTVVVVLEETVGKLTF